MIPCNRAIFSDCRKYRYLLTREFAEDEGRVCFIMLNPSTANQTEDDATIRSCTRFAGKLGFGSLWVVNLFAFRSTDPENLNFTFDPIGPDNNKHIMRAVRRSDLVVAAWGKEHVHIKRRAAAVKKLIFKSDRKIYCLGKTKDGSPRHPLYLSYKGLIQLR
jgi:hypothetical protein